jgi:hypothetical protein
MEEEAEKIRQMQNEVEKQMSRSGPAPTSNYIVTYLAHSLFCCFLAIFLGLNYIDNEAVYDFHTVF